MKRSLMRIVPWRYMVTKFAKRHGFVDPNAVMKRVHGFSQPAEVQFPVELLRSGAIIHARGLVNTQAIQHNLDWVWPYWVERQFDPSDISFLPRAFSLTHVNLTHRNWTSVGLPDLDEFPIVDPAGLVTPFWDSWSLDVWLKFPSGEFLIPARAADLSQTLLFENGLTVQTQCSAHGASLKQKVTVERSGETAILTVSAEATLPEDTEIIVALCPYNPEGVSETHAASFSSDRSKLTVNGTDVVTFRQKPDYVLLSDYDRGDVYGLLRDGDIESPREVTCDQGMASAAAAFKFGAGSRQVEFQINVDPDFRSKTAKRKDRVSTSWEQALQDTAKLSVPDERFVFIYDAAVRSCIHHSPEQVYPGPYTYRRFWFRDAAFILKALLSAGAASRVRRTLEMFPSLQTKSGYYLSQEGEWDSNGEAIWIMSEYLRATGEKLPDRWSRSIEKGGEWIIKKLRSRPGQPWDGLYPAGFSAEHLGPSDYYYWDNFWGVSGLERAAELIPGRAREFNQAAALLRDAIDRSIAGSRAFKKFRAIPAAPLRRMDAGAIGNMVASYPLQLYPPDEPRVLATAEFLLENCFFEGAFLQDMIHSGLNPYLTVHVAQVLLRAGDPRHFELATKVAELASPTAQWPEAVHPRTKGGCMGDGQHIWAAAEWIELMKALFVREEGKDLHLLPGLPRKWFLSPGEMSFGPTYTRFGRISVKVLVQTDSIKVSWSGDAARSPNRLFVHSAQGAAEYPFSDGEAVIPR